MNKVILSIICLLFIVSCRDRVVLLGDSTMAGKYVAPIMRHQFEYMMKGYYMEGYSIEVTNMGIIGQQSWQLRDRLEGGNIVVKDSIVVVLIGINDVLNGYQDYQVCANILRIVIKLKHDNNLVYVVPILPCDGYRQMDINKIETVKSIRAFEKAMCGSQYRIVPIWFGDKQQLMEGLDAGDHLHINEFGQDMLAMAMFDKIFGDMRWFK